MLCAGSVRNDPVMYPTRLACDPGAITGKESGFTWYSMLPNPGTEYSMSYKLKFSEDFDWTRGGKLPGMCGGEGENGAACPVGCSSVSKDRGFSMRLMWREDGAIVTYAYYPDKPESIRCGEDWPWSKKIQSGKWYHVRLYAKLNTVDGDDAKADGVFKAWLDGKQVLDKNDIRYRYNDDFEISRAYMTTCALDCSFDRVSVLSRRAAQRPCISANTANVH